MSYSFTLSNTATFTVTHARHMAAKVAADLKRIQRFYGQPSDASINEYEQELVAFLKAGYLDTVTYGFKRGDQFIEPTLQYTAKDLAGGSVSDDDPGLVRPRADVQGATFYSFLTYSAAWWAATQAERNTFGSYLPLQRSSAAEPTIGGYLSADRTYSSGGRALNRSSVRNFG